MYGYPPEKAAPVALRTILEFLNTHPGLSVRLVLYNMGTLNVFQRALKEMQG